jgi:nucleoside-diphosphate-sugar epimerase
MKTIVTGGAGFIGSHLVDRLLTEGAEVTVVDNFDPFYNRAEKESNLALARRNPRFRLIELDIRDASGALGVVEECRPDAIVHLAARAGVRPSIADPRLYTEVNVLGTLAYLEAAVRLEPRPDSSTPRARASTATEPMARSVNPTRPRCRSAPMPRPSGPANCWHTRFITCINCR